MKNFHDIRYTTGKYEGDYVPVLLKVPTNNSDIWQKVEYIYSKMAKKSGIIIPETYLIYGKKSKLAFYAIRRFDIKENGERLHTCTFAGLINESFSTVKHDYCAFLRTTEVITNDQTQVFEAYRRMVFNYLACNRDDHAKNFSFCMDLNGIWTISPAYDIGFSKGRMNNNTMAINGKTINPTIKDFRLVAEEFRVKNWKEILSKTIESLKTFPDLAQKIGLNKNLIRKIYTPMTENIKKIEKDLYKGK